MNDLIDEGLENNKNPDDLLGRVSRNVKINGPSADVTSGSNELNLIF